MNILLIGARASGKSTIGPLLAGRLNHSFADLDDCVLATFAHDSIVGVWESCGEQAWRDAEVRCLQEVISGDRRVIALGGGTVMTAANQKLIEQAKVGGRAKVAYLRCQVQTLVRRLSENPGDRPHLSESPLDVEVAQTLRRREPTYLALADVIADADRTVNEVVEFLAQALA